MPPPDLSQTFCSRTAAIVAIAAQRRNISGESRLSVHLTNPSIQDSDLRRPAPFVAGDVVAEPVWVLLGVVVAPIPPRFAIVWNQQCSVVFEFDWVFELFFDLGDYVVFGFFGVLDCECVVVL